MKHKFAIKFPPNKDGLSEDLVKRQTKKKSKKAPATSQNALDDENAAVDDSNPE